MLKRIHFYLNAPDEEANYSIIHNEYHKYSILMNPYTQQACSSLTDFTFAHIIVEEQEHRLTITLNRPDKKNAMDPVLLREMAFALSYAKYNSDIWAVVIAANGTVFCAGADLNSFTNKQAQPTTSTVPMPNGDIVLGDLFTKLYKPCIAKVHAPVYAGGFLIICGCTHVIAVDSAQFSLPEVKRGIWPFQVMQSMLQIMPPRAVLDFCMKGKTVNATEALHAGLVSQVVTNAALDHEVNKLTAELFVNSPSAIRLGLKAYDELKSKSHEEAYTFLMQALSETIKTEDAAEGILAFKEKRKPNWKGK